MNSNARSVLTSCTNQWPQNAVTRSANNAWKTLWRTKGNARYAENLYLQMVPLICLLISLYNRFWNESTLWRSRRRRSWSSRFSRREVTVLIRLMGCRWCCVKALFILVWRRWWRLTRGSWGTWCMSSRHPRIRALMARESSLQCGSTQTCEASCW